MAVDEDKEKGEQEGEGQSPQKSKKKLIIIVAAVGLLVVAGVVGVLFMGGEKHDEEALHEEEAERPLAHVDLKPFIVNLSLSLIHI